MHGVIKSYILGLKLSLKYLIDWIKISIEKNWSYIYRIFLCLDYNFKNVYVCKLSINKKVK